MHASTAWQQQQQQQVGWRHQQVLQGQRQQQQQHNGSLQLQQESQLCHLPHDLQQWLCLGSATTSSQKAEQQGFSHRQQHQHQHQHQQQQHGARLDEAESSSLTAAEQPPLDLSARSAVFSQLHSSLRDHAGAAVPADDDSTGVLTRDNGGGAAAGAAEVDKLLLVDFGSMGCLGLLGQQPGELLDILLQTLRLLRW
jgi:hypothetical protein